MKTNQVRLNRSAARPSPQAKTARNHKPETVRIVVNGEDGESFADFEIPRAFYAAMQRDAQAKGISMLQWIEDATRAAVQNHKPAAVQPQIDNVPIDLCGIEDKLDEAVLMSNGMSELLCRALFAGSDGESAAGYGTRIRSGIELLVMETHDRLERALKAIEVAAYGKREVAA